MSGVVSTHPARWLQCTAPDPDARIRLVCFPHAGGSAAFFRSWGTDLPGIEVHAVCYPGRGQRIDEPPSTDLRQLAHGVADAVAQLADRPVALFGHSMGAPIALETATALEARGVQPVRLFASGSRNAPYPPAEDWQNADDEDDAAVVERLLTLGGTDPELAADPEFQELVLPYVRADGQMFHSYVPRPGLSAQCPVTTITGDIDEDADLRPWAELTRGGLQEHGVSGDHFYLVSEPPYALLREALTAPAAVR
ncbi:thioesterase [Streptomyces inhibens]|uniref:Thioesterase n=1 Tax=Streptomyces inhibens TaxID=2293571 RepID=A0A371PQV6_STRIH|nr:alpha/beta fold hydrolase [Streptomyces inhibens]REK84493.1 thioesterase [Streptomyces inhibens]